MSVSLFTSAHEGLANASAAHADQFEALAKEAARKGKCSVHKLSSKKINELLAEVNYQPEAKPAKKDDSHLRCDRCNRKQELYHDEESGLSLCEDCADGREPVKVSHSSHANCEHEATKAARAKCRRERAKAEKASVKETLDFLNNELPFGDQ